MGKTIKDVEVIAYKGMNSDMSCSGFQYELGKTYKTDKVELYECGFHACLNPLDVLDYYYQEEGSRYFKVKLSGEITKCDFDDTNVAATEITILEEINIDEIIKTTEWWKNENILGLLYWSDGLARVQRGDGDYNFIDKQGKILSNEWFEWVDNFKEGFARLQRSDGQYNFIDKEGKILSDEWFNLVDNFQEGFAVVQRGDKKYNLIDKKGKYLIDEWFYWADNFHDGLAKVKRGYVYNFIDKQGKILSDEWFNLVDNFHEGFAVVQRVVDEKYNFIDKDGKILSDEWFEWVDNFKDGLAEVKRANGEWCKIDRTGTVIKIQ